MVVSAPLAGLPRRRRALVCALAAAGAAAAVVYLVAAVAGAPAELRVPLFRVVIALVLSLCAGLCAVRAVSVPEERGAWAAFGPAWPSAPSAGSSTG